MERTLTIVKPDSMEARNAGNILAQLEGGRLLGLLLGFNLDTGDTDAEVTQGGDGDLDFLMVGKGEGFEFLRLAHAVCLSFKF